MLVHIETTYRNSTKLKIKRNKVFTNKRNESSTNPPFPKAGAFPWRWHNIRLFWQQNFPIVDKVVAGKHVIDATVEREDGVFCLVIQVRSSAS